MKLRLLICALVSICVALASVGSQAAEALSTYRDESPNSWVVYPAINGLSVDQAQAVRGFVQQIISERFPQTEFGAAMVSGGILLRLRAGQDLNDNTSLHEALQSLPGVLGAAPLPSASELLRARARELARGGITSQASGLIIRYRNAEKRVIASSGGVLETEELARLSKATGQEIVRSRAMSGFAFVADFNELTDIYTAELAAQRLQMDPLVEMASPNGFAEAARVSTDEYFNLQWNLTNPTGGINVSPAWDLTVGNSEIVVAVIDTGVLPHPEFSGRLLPGYDFISDPARSNDGDGRDTNAYDSGDWRSAGQCGSGSVARNSSWHGTHVAGIIAAAGDNGAGIAGINWRSRILPVRVLGSCGGTESDILDGLRWAAGLAVPGVPTNPFPARVINMSLGGTGNCLLTRQEYQIAVLEALAEGATVVVAAGNDNESALTRVPASCVGTIKVAAIGPTGDKTNYSNYSRAIEVAAPGGDTRFGASYGIPSAFATGTQSDPGHATWEYRQGTSQAAPHVSGVASLILSLRPGLTVAQVRDLIRLKSRRFPLGTSCNAIGDCGLGILDAGTTVQFVPQIASRLNFSDLWWVPSESGWGVNLQQQGDKLFATWFTYDSQGQPRWLVMSDIQRQAEDFFVGDIYLANGTPFNLINGSPAAQGVRKVGTAIFAFFGVGLNLNPNLGGVDSSIFYYDFGSFAGLKPVGRYLYALPFTACQFRTGSRASLTNYQDLWWKPDESGWGLNLSHQGDSLFATWFTFDSTGQAAWFLGSDVRRIGPQQYSGRLYRATGVPIDQIGGAQASQTVTDVGHVTITFVNGESGRFDYVVNGISGSKPIQRYVFSSPLSFCAPAQ